MKNKIINPFKDYLSQHIEKVVNINTITKNMYVKLLPGIFAVESLKVEKVLVRGKKKINFEVKL